MAYRYKSLRVKGRRIDEHRYVMEQYLGRRLERHEIVHHINGNPRDNRLDNLMLMSVDEHTAEHAKSAPGVKLTERKVARIKYLLSVGVGVVELSIIYGVTQSSISRIKLGETWREIPPMRPKVC